MGLWLRRSSATLAFPAMLLTEIMVLFSRTGWNHEWGWAFSEATTGTILLAPLVAGLVAFDRARRVEPTLASLGMTSPKGVLGDVALVIASWFYAVAAWGVGLIVAATWARIGGAIGFPDVWVLVEGLVVLLLGACVGVAVGVHVKGLLAGPVAAISFLLARLVAGSAGLGTAFSAGGATGSLLGLRRSAGAALAVIGFHLALAALAVVLALVTNAAARYTLSTRIVATVMSSVVAVGLSVVLIVTSARIQPYQWDNSPQICLGNGVRVCGTADAKYILGVSRVSLDRALTTLSGSGIDWQRNCTLAFRARRSSGPGGIDSISRGDRQG